MPHSYRDEAQRRQWQNPDRIVEKIGVKAGDVFIDLACGSGFFAIPAARIIGSKGVVCGVDIDSEALEELHVQAAQAGLNNIRFRFAAAEKVALCERCADMVFVGIALHEQRPAQGIAECSRRSEVWRQTRQLGLEKRADAVWAAY